MLDTQPTTYVLIETLNKKSKLERYRWFIQSPPEFIHRSHIDTSTLFYNLFMATLATFPPNCCRSFCCWVQTSHRNSFSYRFYSNKYITTYRFHRSIATYFHCIGLYSLSYFIVIFQILCFCFILSLNRHRAIDSETLRVILSVSHELYLYA